MLSLTSCNNITEKVGTAAPFRASLMEVLISNLGSDIGVWNDDLGGFFSSVPREMLVCPRPPPSKLFLFHLSPYHSTPCNFDNESVVKQPIKRRLLIAL
jgi:hypothetical protein